MNKKEAASYLSVSTKAIERYVARGKLHVTYQRKASGGQEAIYDNGELELLKAEMQQPKLTIAKTEPRDTATRQDSGLVSVSTLMAGIDRLVARIEALQPDGQPAAPIADLAVKLTLSLQEAARLSGMPADVLSKAIRKDRLKAIKIDGELRIKRAALEKFVSKL